MFWFFVLYVVFYHRSGDSIGDGNGSSSGSGNFAASFAALSAYSLPGRLVCPWTQCRVVFNEAYQAYPGLWGQTLKSQCW